MHRIIIAVLVSLWFGAPACADEPQHPALAAWAAAWAGDDARLRALYSPDAHVFTPDARVQATDAAWLDDALARDRTGYPRRRLIFGRHAWRDCGGVAVASGIALAELVDADGVRTTMALRFSLVWVGGEGFWRILDQHLSLLAFEDE